MPFPERFPLLPRRKRVLYFVYSLKGGVQNCLWMGLVTACWYAVMDPKVRDVDNRLQYVTRLILCIFVASALKLAEVSPPVAFCEKDTWHGLLVHLAPTSRLSLVACVLRFFRRFLVMSWIVSTLFQSSKQHCAAHMCCSCNES